MGVIGEFRFLTKSGVYAFDLEAQGAIESAGSAKAFGALPDGYVNDFLPVVFTLRSFVVSLMTRICFARRCSVLALTFAPFVCVAAQDSLPPGVRLDLRYDPGTKPGVLVLRVAGANGDSIRAILQRDFDNGDRINVVAAEETGFPDTPTAGKNGNYPVYAKLGALALVQATPTASGLHVAVHDVALQKVAGVRDFVLSGAPNSREWRMSVHMASDELESWITGVRGIAATRVAYVQGVRGSKLFIVDSDGAFPTPVGDDAGVLSPAWHPKGTHIAYSLVGARGCCQIFVYDLASGSARQISAVGGGVEQRRRRSRPTAV